MNNNNTFQGFDDKLMYMYTQVKAITTHLIIYVY